MKANYFNTEADARWAIFFEELGIPYLYENKFIIISNGSAILPSFYLPNFHEGTYGIVKSFFDDESIEECYLLFEKTKKTVVFLEGMPDYKCQKVIHDLGQSHPIYSTAIFCADQAQYNNGFFWNPGYEDKDLTISSEYFDCLGESFTDAVYKAKSYQIKTIYIPIK